MTSNVSSYEFPREMSRDLKRKIPQERKDHETGLRPSESERPEGTGIRSECLEWFETELKGKRRRVISSNELRHFDRKLLN